MTPNCDHLADFIESHKASLMQKWLVDAREDDNVPTDDLNTRELTDHIPQVFDNVVAGLRNQCGRGGSEVQNITARHTVVRWVQNYDLRAVLREVSLLRIEFIYLLVAFNDKFPETDSEARLMNATALHEILDDIIFDATETFIMLKHRQIEDR